MAVLEADTEAVTAAAGSNDAPGAAEAWRKEKSYWLVALILAVVTGIEVSTYTHPDLWGEAAVPSLLFMMAVKFFMVTWFFMHLKGDWAHGHRILTYVFYAGLFLAGLVYAAYLATLHFF